MSCSPICFATSAFSVPGIRHGVTPLLDTTMPRLRHSYVAAVPPRHRSLAVIMTSSTSNKNKNDNEPDQPVGTITSQSLPTPTSTSASSSPPLTSQSLLRMPESTLESLYKASPVGSVPSGHTRGTMLFFPGTPFTPVLARLVRATTWTGKLFDSNSGTILNKILPFGRLHTVRAKAYHGESLLLPTEKAIVLDYTVSTWPWSLIRDELRMVAPGLYLGPAYIGGKKRFYFTLEQEEEKNDEGKKTH